MAKINPLTFYNLLKNNNINFFTGIPDSLLKEFNNVILKNTNKSHHIITANEGSAIALATGYHFATREVPLVYLQNSGTGNIINPLMSLVPKDVYSIPMLIIIGWRGEPGVKDEPQHLTQGLCMEDLIKSLGLTYDILTNNIENVENIIIKSLNTIKNNSSPHILLVKKNTFENYEESIKIENQYTLYRKDAIESLINYFTNDIILCTTGKSSRELLESANKLNINQDNIFLNVGAMGHVSMISYGIALNTTKNVLCIDGDGSVIMHMGNLTSIGTGMCNNIYHIVLNNGMHESVGIQPTCGFNINFTTIAKGCGYNYCKKVKSIDEITILMDEIKQNDIKGPYFIEVCITNKINYDHELSRPKDKPLERKIKFMNFINF
jgi:phosphonopyruvate decarboxylase